MLEKVGGVLGEVGHLVRSCHERWDGSGYPDRLAGEDIPLVARIVCACDAFSAMTTDRPVSQGAVARPRVAELRRCSGTQFDPRSRRRARRRRRLTRAVAGRHRPRRTRECATNDLRGTP